MWTNMCLLLPYPDKDRESSFYCIWLFPIINYFQSKNTKDNQISVQFYWSLLFLLFTNIKQNWSYAHSISSSFIKHWNIQILVTCHNPCICTHIQHEWMYKLSRIKRLPKQNTCNNNKTNIRLLSFSILNHLPLLCLHLFEERWLLGPR